MPELPEVETIRRSLEPHLLGRTVASATLHRRDVLIAPGDPAGGFARARSAPHARPRRIGPSHLLVGASLSQLRRRGKQLAILAADGRALVIQLGMSGQLLIADHPGLDHVHAVWNLGPPVRGHRSPTTLRFRDPRRFGGLRFFPTAAALDQHWSALGPDALSITPNQLAVALEQTSSPIKAALLDQSRLAGVGNIYADEALFESRIHPLARADRLRPPQIEALASAIRSVLARAITAGGSTLRDYRNGDGDPGQAQDGFLVYGRARLPCPRCGSPLVAIQAAQRTTTFCRACQTRRTTGPPHVAGFPQTGPLIHKGKHQPSGIP